MTSRTGRAAAVAALLLGALSASAGGRRKAAGRAAALLLGALLAAGPASGQAGRRVALVVGNDAYGTQTPLVNAVNDARSVASALGEVGFAVERLENATRAELATALADFGDSLRPEDVALFYFAGHGVQVGGVNYLIPTDYAGRSASSLRLTALSAVDVQAMLGRARVAMLVLDACRNNPYRGVRGGEGLARMDPRGTLIAYAAGAGEFAIDASDDDASNGLFTAKFVEALREPGLSATDLFRRVRREVYAASNEEQRPAVYDDLDYPFVFRPAVVVGGGDACDAETDRLFWESIRASTRPAEFEAYKRRCPRGRYVELADIRLAALRGAVPPGAPSAPVPESVAADPPAGRRVGEVFRDCAGCPEMVVVPAGSFMMGSPASEQRRSVDEGPQHRVTIPSPFAVGVYEVTFAEWDACVADGGCGGYRPDDEGWGRGSRPVINVNWEEAQSYVRWLSRETGETYRLLSESEWEYVARGGTTMSRYWGASNESVCLNANGADWAVSCDDGHPYEAAPVGSYTTNDFGLYDVLGNVWEWVEDCEHANYAGAPSDGSAWTSGGDCRVRTSRGGSWGTYPSFLRSALRSQTLAFLSGDTRGFRVSRTLD